MSRFIFILPLISSLVFSSSFENDCLKCHKEEGIPLDMIYKRYLLKYSSKQDIKVAMVKFLKNPSMNESSMPPGLLMNMGIKSKSKLSSNELEKMIDEYLSRYDIKKRLVPMKTK